MSTRKQFTSGPVVSRPQGAAAPVVSIIHIRRDRTSLRPWVMRSCTCERRVPTLGLALEAAACAASAAGKMGRAVLIRLHQSTGGSETFTVRELQARIQNATLTAAVASLAQMWL